MVGRCWKWSFRAVRYKIRYMDVTNKDHKVVGVSKKNAEDKNTQREMIRCEDR